ncbi:MULTISPECIES: serine hydrolase domain-containing protein [Flavobacteriaceae]|uniref:serine hydrolase domain-containing protein n=1 Tax=Flavobacteriaceae TaxID=49546 RepID=UPI001491CEB6|nr:MULTISPECIES: serine hydrolase domain-containing protein [Allomuricauda]MDC6367544.1 serine hydrolase [Muricauda sp. AC10]
MENNQKTNRKYIITSVSILFLFTTISCSSQQKSNLGNILKEETRTKLNTYLEEVIQQYDLPGLSVGIVKDGKLAYAKAFGNQNMVEKTPIKTNSVFHMASISKLFVATAIMQLEEKGKLSLNDLVVEHLPYFKLNDERYKDITIQQLLSHISGMPDTDDYGWDNPRYDDNALEDYVKSLFDLKLNSNPGEKYAYSNIAFEVLGDVIAKVSGMSFEAYQTQYILKPLNMYHSTFLKTEELPKKWAAPHMRFSYNKTWNTYPYNRAHAPSSTLHSNIMDMAQFALANLNKGNLNGTKILEPSAYDQLWNHWVDRGDERYRGLAWSIQSFEGNTIYSHSGSDVGFTTNFVLIPEENLGVIVLANVDNAPVGRITGNILRTMLNIDLKISKPAAFIPVTNLYEKEGLHAAVKLWKELKTQHPETYNFDPDTSSALFYAMFMDDTKETKKLSFLVKEIFEKDIHAIIIEEATDYQKHFPDNQSAKIILDLFKND